MLTRLFAIRDNTVESVWHFLKKLKVKVTFSTLEKDLISHPDYPSLLSISDVLSGYGVENMGVTMNQDNLKELPTPFLAQVEGEKSHISLFSIVESVSGNMARFFNPEKHQWQLASVEDFKQQWGSGVALFVDATTAREEPAYSHKKNRELRNRYIQYAAILLLPILTFAACTIALFGQGKHAIGPVIFSLLTLAGTMVSTLLLWYESDEANPLLQQICRAGKKISCGAVLHSKVSGIFGISWGIIGFTYFAGGLLTLLFAGLTNPGALSLLTWLNTLAVPYIVFSLYYQGAIVKKWCILCLTIQGILALQFVTAMVAHWHMQIPVQYMFTNNVIWTALVAYALVFVSVNMVFPLFGSSKDKKNIQAQLSRLKHNPEIFRALLKKQKSIKSQPDGLGITLGNKTAIHTIIKVCNPYCGPCAKAHPIIDNLLEENPNLTVQIIFTATIKDDDVRTPPAKHLLAIAATSEEGKVKKALDDWYLADNKDYDLFASKYPMNGELKQQDKKIEAMSAWCDKNEIRFTPTFFIDGYQLPEIYNVEELKYFLYN